MRIAGFMNIFEGLGEQGRHQSLQYLNIYDSEKMTEYWERENEACFGGWGVSCTVCQPGRIEGRVEGVGVRWQVGAPC